MERGGRKKDILELALKTSGIRDKKKCRKSLLFEFEEGPVQPVLTGRDIVITKDKGMIKSRQQYCDENKRSDEKPTILACSSTHDDDVTNYLPLDAPDVLSESVPGAASSASSMLPVASTSFDSTTILTNDLLNVPNSKATVVTQLPLDATDKHSDSVPGAASSASSMLPVASTSFDSTTILTNDLLNVPNSKATVVTQLPLDATDKHSDSVPGAASSASSMLPVASTSFDSTTILTNDLLNVPNSKATTVTQLLSEVFPSTSSENNNARSAASRITRPAKINSYLDYMSDDERDLLNAFGGDAGSSDEWEPEKSRKKKKQMSLEIEEETVGSRKVKKAPKNKRKQVAESRLSGQSYVKTNGIVSEEKKVQTNPCVGKKCGNNCGDITEERRLRIFKHFWSLSEQRRKEWIANLTQKTSVKRKRNKDSETRNVTYKYNITDGESHRQVCLQFLAKTIDVSHKYIYYTVSNVDEFGSSKESQRGKNIPPNKTSSNDLTAVDYFIKSLPAVPSHYCRKDSTRTYLPTEYKNLANLYRKYKEHRSSQGLSFVSESIFRKVFNENFNIAFHIPKKDKCRKCCQFEAKTDLTPEEQQGHEAHLLEKEHTYNRYKMHKTIHTKDPASLCISFDLQKVLHTPYGQSMLLFYASRLNVFNAVIYENGTRNVFCYYWDESQGNRGANEMATILNKYITKIDERGNIKRLLIYCDCCPGQNRNKIVLAMISETLQRCKNIESIQLNFLLTGHTYMTVDSAHATIENQVKNTIIWAPSQWYTVFQTARHNPRPFEVERLTHKDFKRWDLVADKYFVGNLVGKISKIRVATFKKNRTSATVKLSMDPEADVSFIEIASKTKLLEVPDCYSAPLAIPEKKHKDLWKLCSNLVIPQQFQAEYLALTANKKIKETLPDTDIEDE